MMKIKRIICLILLVSLIGLPSYAMGHYLQPISSPRITETGGLDSVEVILNDDDFAKHICNGSYANLTHKLTIKITNGNHSLTTVNVSHFFYNATSGTGILIDSGSNASLIPIGEYLPVHGVGYVDVYFTPPGYGDFWLNFSIKAESIVGEIFQEWLNMSMSIRTYVDRMIKPYTRLDEPMSPNGYYQYGVDHTINVSCCLCGGNRMFSENRPLNVTIWYNNSGNLEFEWTDEKLFPNWVKWFPFPGWHPSRRGEYMVNTTWIVDDYDNSNNFRNTSFMIQNVSDAAVEVAWPYPDHSYALDQKEIVFKVKNSGNNNTIPSGSQVNLTVRYKNNGTEAHMATNTTMYDIGPGEFTFVNFTWLPPIEANYSIEGGLWDVWENTSDILGVDWNNNATMNTTIENVTDVDLWSVNHPQKGTYSFEEGLTINVSFRNEGTLPVLDLPVHVSVSWRTNHTEVFSDTRTLDVLPYEIPPVEEDIACRSVGPREIAVGETFLEFPWSNPASGDFELKVNFTAPSGDTDFENPKLVIFTLYSISSISGTLKHGATPLVGHQVSLKWGTETKETVISGSSGVFTFENGYESGTYNVTADGGYLYEDGFIEIQHDGVADLDDVVLGLEKKMTTMASGNVSFNESIPDGGGRLDEVSVHVSTTEVFAVPSVNPDDEGHFSVEVLQGKEVTLEAVLDHYSMDSAMVDTENDTQLHNVSLLLTPDWPIVSTTPSYRAMNIEAPEDITVVWDTAMNASTFNTTTISLSVESTQTNLLNASSFSLGDDNKTLTITAASPLEGGRKYILNISKDVRGAGNDTHYTSLLWTNYISWFETQIGTGTIKGSVFQYIDNITSVPLMGVNISGDGAAVETDEFGNYTLEVEAGTIELVAAKFGFTVFEAPDPVEVSGGSVVENMNFTMKERGPPFECGLCTDNVDVPVMDFVFRANFSEPINKSAVKNSTITLGKLETRAILLLSGETTADNTSVTFTASEDLEYNTTYELTIKAADIQNATGSPILWRDWVIVFATEQRPIATLEVTVVDSTSKAPIENATVSLSGASNSRVTDNMGSATFENLTARTEVNVTAIATNYAANYMVIMLSEGLNEVTLEMESDIIPEEPTISVVMGPFKNNKGENIVDADIFLNICGKEYLSQTGSDGKATFKIKISDLEGCEEDVEVTFEHDDYPTVKFYIPIAAFLAGIDTGEVEVGLEGYDWVPPTKEEKGDEEDGDLMLWLIIIIIIIVVVVIVAAVAMRSKRPAEPDYVPRDEEPIPPEHGIEEIPVGVATPDQQYYPEEPSAAAQDTLPEELAEEDLEEELPDLDEEEIGEEEMEEEVPQEEFEDEIEEEAAQEQDELQDEETQEEFEEEEVDEEGIEEEAVEEDDLNFDDVDEDLELGEEEDDDLDLDFDEVENL